MVRPIFLFILLANAARTCKSNAMADAAADDVAATSAVVAAGSITTVTLFDHHTAKHTGNVGCVSQNRRTAKIYGFFHERSFFHGFFCLFIR